MKTVKIVAAIMTSLTFALCLFLAVLMALQNVWGAAIVALVIGLLFGYFVAVDCIKFFVEKDQS